MDIIKYQFFQTIEAKIGIVVVQKQEERQAFVGTAFSKDDKECAEYIAQNGTRFPLRIAGELMRV